MSSSENESSASSSSYESDDDSFKTPAGSAGSKSPEAPQHSDTTGKSKSIPCPKDCKPLTFGGSSAVTASDFTSSDYEAWLISAPANIAVENLPNKKISFQHESVAVFGKKEYELTPYTGNGQRINLLVVNNESKARVLDLELAGEVRISEHEEIPQVIIPKTTKKKTPQPPSDLKLRHPIYGADYEEVIEKNSQMLRKKSKSKKRKAVDILGESNSVETPVKKEKRKKRKSTIAE